MLLCFWNVFAMNISQFLGKIVLWLATILTIGPGLDWVVTRLGVGAPPALWAMSVTLGLALLHLLSVLCAYKHGILQDELNRVVDEKSKLNGLILQKQRTSRKGGR